MSRSERKILAARVGAPGAYERVLGFEDAEAMPRIVEVGSREGKPLRVMVGWTLSGGVGGKILLTTAFATRVCVFARTLTVDACNLSQDSHEVTCLVADGVVPTSNVYELEYESPPTSEQVPVPPFARSVRIDPSISGASGFLRLINGNSLPIGRRDIADMPAGGLLVGGAATVIATCSTPCRVVFELSI